VGRTDAADISFPDDREMSPVHFAMNCHQSDFRVRSLTGRPSILVNGVAVTEAILKPGDQLTAGETTFEVFASELPPPAFTAPPDKPEVAAEPMTPIELAEYLDLDEDAQAIATTVTNSDEFLAALVQQDLLAAAIRLQAHLLPKRECIGWGVACVRRLSAESLTGPEQNAVTAAESWTAHADEERREAARLAVEAAGLKGPAGWLAQAVVWNEGSLAPPERGPVEPDERLTGQAVTTSLLLSAVEANPTAVSSEYRAFLRQAQSRGGGQDG
jgi:hypothetical protein